MAHPGGVVVVTPTRLTLQSVILRLLAADVDKRLGRGRHYFIDVVRNQFRPPDQPDRGAANQVLWSLVGQGLVWIDTWQSEPENWTWQLTDTGLAASKDQDANPDDPDGFLACIRSRVPAVSPLVMMYATDAVRSYTTGCYLASAVMLGVASEALFLEVAESLVAFLDGPQAKNLADVLRSTKSSFLQKFVEFRTRLETAKPKLPVDVRDGMDLRLNAAIDLLRLYRNDSGHPTGKALSRSDQFLNLRMFVALLEQMSRLQEALVAGPT